jgi:uncharacterized protein DUF3987/bifunctional DNA primase/polymerase-like protein/primase-like protein
MKAATSATLEAAKTYIEHGWSVIPIRPRNKSPLIPWKEYQARMASPDELAEWFDDTENNIGVVAGELSNLTIVDCDTEEAIRFFEEESLKRGEPTATYIIKTPKGRHYYFQYVPGSNNFQAKREWPGIDLRSEGGYVVAPPSIHPSGKRYTVLHDVPLGIAPSWLFQPASQSHAKATNTNSADPNDNLFAPCAEGGRNMALTRLSGSLLPNNPLETVIEICRLWNQRNSIPLPDEELCRTVESVAKKESQKNEAWPEPIPLENYSAPEFPKGLFPDCVDEMIDAISLATETPRELAAGLGLASVGAACQRGYEIEAETGYIEPLSLWVCAAMDSGNRKTAVKNAVTAPLSDYEQEQCILIGPKRKAAESERKTAEARIHHLRTRAAKEESSVDFVELSQEIAKQESTLPKVPTIPQIWVEDITPEKLAQIMDEQGGVLSIISDEGGIFENVAGRYNGGTPNLDLILKAHSGSAVRIHRVGRESIVMNSPTLTMGLSPQPEVLRSLIQKQGFRGYGLLARFLYVIPTSRLGFRTLEPKPVSETVRRRYSETIRNLLMTNPPPKEDGTFSRYRLKLTPSAHSEWKEFSRVVEHDMRDGEKFQYIRDWAGKLPGAAARVAGLLHCATHANDKPWNHPVALSTMEQALTLMAILAEHAIQAFEIMAVDPDIEKAKKILNWIQRKGSGAFTMRTCHRDLEGSFKRVEDLKPGLDVLVERGFIRHDTRNEKRSGRPSVTFDVNPRALGRIDL